MDNTLKNVLNATFTNGISVGVILSITIHWLWNKAVYANPEDEDTQVQRVVDKLNNRKAFDWQRFGEGPGIAQRRGRANG